MTVRPRLGVVDGVPAAIRRPNPAMGVAIDRARPALDFDQQEAGGCQDEQIDLVDPPFVIHELEVRPCPPRLVVR